MQFDNTTGGTGTSNLALTYTTATSNTLGGTAGINFNVTAGQTGSISIVSGQTGSNTIALRVNTAALTVASGAGAFTFGNGGANILPLTFGNGTASTEAFVNNNATGGNAVTFNSDVSFIPGGQAAHRASFAGTGDFVVNNVITNTGVGTGGTLGVDVLGTGRVTFNGANSTFTGVVGTTNGLTIGTANGTSIARATATQALGSGTIGILGNGAVGQTASNRLELTGNISLNNAFVLSGKTAATTGASIENISGANTLSGTMTATTGGNFYQIQSDAGTLTLSNATGFTLGTLTGTRTLTVQGAGNGLVSGVLSNGTSTGILAVSKAGAGTWTLGGVNTYTGATTVGAGTLLISTGGSLAAGSAVAVNGGRLGGTGTVNGTVTLASGATLLAGDGTTAAGVLTLTVNPVLNAATGTIIELTLGATSAHSTLALTAGGFNGFNTNQSFTLDNIQPGTYDNIITGVAAGIDTTAWTATNGSGYTVTFTDDGANIDLSVSVVPEPSTWALTAVGLVGAAVWMRRKRAVA